MPLREALLIAVKDGLIELTAEVNDPQRDDPAAFVESVRERLSDHLHLIMTDPAILDPMSMAVASCVMCRDPLPEGLKEGLRRLGFSALSSPPGARGNSSLFSRFLKTRRPQLDRWRTQYLRAHDTSVELGALENALFETTPEGPLNLVENEAADALIQAASDTLNIAITPGLEGLTLLERGLIRGSTAARGQLVLHPSSVRAIAAFTASSLRTAAPGTSWAESSGDNEMLLVKSGGGLTVETDVQLRVIRFVGQGEDALLSEYADSVLRQSLTGTAQA